MLTLYIVTVLLGAELKSSSYITGDIVIYRFPDDYTLS